MAATGRAIVYGGKGGLGTVIVNHFKSKGWWICSIDLAGNDQADTNVLVNPNDSWIEQETKVCEAVAGLLVDQKVVIVIFIKDIFLPTIALLVRTLHILKLLHNFT